MIGVRPQRFPQNPAHPTEAQAEIPVGGQRERSVVGGRVSLGGFFGTMTGQPQQYTEMRRNSCWLAVPLILKCHVVAVITHV